MWIHDATEQAFKRGYEKGYEAGKKDAIVRGRWLYDSMSRKYFCAICGEEACYDECRYHFGNYCPNCGAKMDGDGNG